MSGITLRETVITRPWYAPGPPDPEPPLLPGFGRTGLPVYPYPVTESLSAEPRPRSLRAVEIENEFLRLVFLPELNGRLYSLYDKLADRETLFANPELKPALVAVRGPWCATGIEINCPSSHTVTTVDEVPCEWGVDESGTGWFRAHDIESVSGTAWSCTTALEPDSARVTMTTRFANPTDDPIRFYLWINAAFPIEPDSRFIFPPSTRQIFMEGGRHPGELGFLDYPVHDGVDMSMLHNFRKHSSNFAVTPDEGFFGLYHPSADHGVAHYADPHLVPGRKVWTWGFAPDGTIWHDALSDTGGPYCELQSGPLRSQLEYRTLGPGQLLQQRDTWLPLRGLGGLRWAGERAAFNWTVDDGQLHLRLLAAEPGSYLLHHGDHTRTVELGPEPCSLELPHDPTEPLHLIDDDEPLARPVRFVTPPARTTWRHHPTATTPWRRARARWWVGHVRDAEQAWSEIADQDARAAAALARLARQRGDQPAAWRWVEQALALDGSAVEALREGALAAREAPDGERPEVWFWEELLGHPEARPAAIVGLVDEALTRGEPYRALDELAALSEEGHDLRLFGRVLHASRRAGQPCEVPLEDVADFAPLDPLLAAELLLAGDDEIRLTVTAQLAAAAALWRLGDPESAAVVLASEPAPAPGQPAALRDLARAILEDAPVPETLDWAGGFCHGRFAIDLLRQALADDGGDDAFRYHLGCALAAANDWASAESLWATCTDGPWAAGANRNLGLAAWQIHRDREAAVAFYRHAAAGDCGPRTLIEQDRLLAELGRHEERPAPLEAALERFRHDGRVPLRLAAALIDGGRPDEALDWLQRTDFRVFEGGGEPQRIWRAAHRTLAEAHLDRGDSAAAAAEYALLCDYPHNLHVGAPADNRDAEWRYRQGQAHAAAGDHEAARAAWDLGVAPGRPHTFHARPARETLPESGPLSVSADWVRNRLFRAACAQRLGDAAAAQAIFAEIEEKMADREVSPELREALTAARAGTWAPAVAER